MSKHVMKIIRHSGKPYYFCAIGVEPQDEAGYNEEVKSLDDTLVSQYKDGEIVPYSINELRSVCDVLYSGFLSLSYARIHDLRRVLQRLAVTAFSQNHFYNVIEDLLIEANSQFSTKSGIYRNGWIAIGLFGNIGEVTQKIQRILNNVENNAEKQDSWVDLYNYCRFAIVSLDNSFLFPVYAAHVDNLEITES